MINTKIFSEDKSIYFISDNDEISDFPLAIKVNVEESKDLEYFLMTEIPVCNEIVFYNSDKEKLTEIMNQFFVYIEAGGGIVKNDKDEILVIRRWGVWDLPKGKIEENESIEEAALREVEEETSVKSLQLKEKICDTYHIYFRNSKAYLKKTYWFKMFTNSKTELVPQYDEDITQAKWMNKENINEMMENTYASIKEVISNYLHK